MYSSVSFSDNYILLLCVMIIKAQNVAGMILLMRASAETFIYKRQRLQYIYVYVETK